MLYRCVLVCAAETDFIMGVARQTHKVVQQANQQWEALQKGQPPANSSDEQKQITPLHHEEITPEEHARANGSVGEGVVGRLAAMRKQMADDAAADWNDIKSKFGK